VASVYAYHHWVKPLPGQRRPGADRGWPGHRHSLGRVRTPLLRGDPGQGGNWGLLDLCIPSRWAAASGNPKDDGTKSAQTPATAATSAATGCGTGGRYGQQAAGGLDFIGGMTSTTTSKKAKKGTPNTPPLVLDILKALDCDRLLSAWVGRDGADRLPADPRRHLTANNPESPHLAMPSEYASTFIIYGALAFIPGREERSPRLFGWDLSPPS